VRKETDDILNDSQWLSHLSRDTLNLGVADKPELVLHLLQHLGDSRADLTIY
jgi:hypothetical protein